MPGYTSLQFFQLKQPHITIRFFRQAYGLTLNGNVTLNSDTSLVRVIMIDDQYNEYLVYEAYKCISLSSVFSLSNLCDETCYSDGFTPQSLEIQIKDATVYISTINLRNAYDPDGESLQHRAKIEMELQKVTNIRNYISANKMVWFADTNNISNLAYTQKKALFGNSYNVMGWDYYRGGIYDQMPGSAKEISNSTIVPEWDWRNRHGADDPGKTNFYYDGDNTGTGWMSFVKNQRLHPGCTELCYVYSSLTVVEGIANLYFNEHKNYDLSIQEVLECDNSNQYCNGGLPGPTLNYVRDHGVVNYNCYPNNEVLTSCQENPFPNGLPEYRIKIEQSASTNTETEIIKSTLINKGPLVCSISNYSNGQSHSIALVGYGVTSIGDTIYNIPSQSGYIIIDAQNSGRDYWIYQNTWGIQWGHYGYVYYFDSPGNGHPNYVTCVENPVDDILTTNDVVHYFDKDNDGYYYWGIGNRPAGCPVTEKDSDDSESRIGPLDANYFSIPVAPEMVVKEGTNTVHKEGVYSFYDQNMIVGQKKMLTFNIINNGTAQLNLIPNLSNQTVTLSNYNPSDYRLITTNLNTKIPKDGGSTSFNIEFTLNAPITEPKMVTVTIHLNEVDMDDFVFTLVYSDCLYTLVPENITTNTVWNCQGALLKFSDVYIKRDATLTVNSLVAFSSGASIYVEQGGTLIIDGGYITALCNDTWQGIDVWGDINKSQFSSPPTIRQEQGVVKLINGGKISYAMIGVETIRYVNRVADYNTSGGIVVVRDGVIDNCRQGVVFYPYENFYPDKSKPRSNWSYFNKAKFFNSNLQLNEAQFFLKGVSGIQIQGSTFENYCQHNNYITTYGIKSYNSTFTVSKINLSPIPTGGSIPTTFEGFEYGIHCSAGRMLSGITAIRSADFDNNLTGIYFSAIENPIITSNEFHVRDNNSKFHLTDPHRGLYLDNYTTGFTVEENKFLTNLATGSLEVKKCVGIIVNNSGGSPNELYNNSFDKLTIGIEAIGNNRDITGAGLCIKCNDFSNCKNDIYVTPLMVDGKLLTGTTIGIAKSQGEVGNGDPTKLAGNTFSRDEIRSNVENGECENFSYIHHLEINENVRPDIYSNIDPKEDVTSNYIKESACPSHLSSYPYISIEKAILSAESNQILHYTDTLNKMVDGGNTYQLVSEVVSAMPDETLQIHNLLLNISPFLSDTVIRAVIENEDVLPNAIVRNVLLANPQSGKSFDLINRLKSRVDTMPDYMIDEIIQASNWLGAKELLEKELNQHKTNFRKSISTVEKYFQSDTLFISNSLDSLLILWNEQSFLDCKYKAAFLYLRKNNFIESNNILYSVESTFDLSDVEYRLHRSYSDLINILFKIQNDSTELDSINKEVLFTLAENFRSLPSTYAMNLLINSNEFYYREPLYFPDYTKTTIINKPFFKYEDIKQFVNIYPNPCNDYIIVDYDLSQFSGILKLTIKDIISNNVYNTTLQNGRTQRIISLNNYKAGVYVLSITEGNNIIESSKLILLK